DSAASVSVDPHRVQIALPEGVAVPPGGLNLRFPDPFLEQEKRLHQFKVPAAMAFARANGIDRVLYRPKHARLGIVTVGKSYLDVRQALDDLHIDEAEAERLGIALYKVGMIYPLEPVGLTEFAAGLDEVLVVEEKRALIETQAKEALYNLPDSLRPRLFGKRDEAGAWMLPSDGELTTARIARTIARRLKGLGIESESINRRMAWFDAKERALDSHPAPLARPPHYCSGCPHNTSTVVPEGSIQLAGIGCHYMVVLMDRNAITFSQMGGEGVAWTGASPFSETPHVFTNLGDGTYFHSGIMAIRAAVAAADVNITYKILYNDAVAMTGGQPVDGTLSVPQIAHQVRSEGVHTIVLLSDDIGKWLDHKSMFPAGVELLDRKQLDAAQKRLREVKGTSVLIFDQTCATEKRRRRKRGKMLDPQKRVAINSLVCEGCGDCGQKSFCVSVLPKETEFGRKRDIDQSNCNKDYSCVSGFCPSFVTVHGGALKKQKASNATELLANLPLPQLPTLDQPWNILITGVGGTGVVTIGALLGMAGHLEGKGASVLDQTGLAQKGGAVTTHIRIANSPNDIFAVRIAAGEADLVLGCDMVVVNDYWALSKIRAGRSNVVLNSYEAMPGTFTTRPDMQFPAADIIKAVSVALGGESPHVVDATQLATALLGDAIMSNLFILGYAWQQGLVPLSLEAIMRAVELNGAAIEKNKAAFAWGRLAVVDPQAVAEAAGLVRNAPTAAEATPHALPMLSPGQWEGHEFGSPSAPRNTRNEDDLRHVPEHAGSSAGDNVVFLPLDDERLSRSLDEVIARRVAFLGDYQNAAYAQRYSQFVAKVRDAEANKAPGSTDLTEAVARYAFKLMAYKDEYEVARLYTSGEFQRKLAQQYEGDYKLRFHLAPPLFAKKDAQGRLIKQEFGGWMLGAFKLMAKLRFLRGSALDIFGYSAERKNERQLIADYEQTIAGLLPTLDGGNVDLAAQIASIPEHIRGYGHVKEAHLHAAKAREAELLVQWHNPLRIVQAA
ncbi:indolepyruvate ferredoxin oxidoreductase family protein, partial [Piscinibacter sp.]|uniref:indolepyruvate ferredoxin oxidoreductase family protein n=1 Tax=Piscinibacter sp. TaxID=1903157 RepID=UPI002C83A8D2